MTKENPLLEKFDLPPFDRIKAEHIKPAIDELINNNKKSIEDLINNTFLRFICKYVNLVKCSNPFPIS